MRRITGWIDGVEHVILEGDRGYTEVPSNLQARLQDPDGCLPLGPALLERCRGLFGDTMQVRDLGSGEGLPPDGRR
jgi:hypothetical protein